MSDKILTSAKVLPFERPAPRTPQMLVQVSQGHRGQASSDYAAPERHRDLQRAASIMGGREDRPRARPFTLETGAVHRGIPH